MLHSLAYSVACPEEQKDLGHRKIHCLPVLADQRKSKRADFIESNGSRVHKEQDTGRSKKQKKQDTGGQGAGGAGYKEEQDTGGAGYMEDGDAGEARCRKEQDAGGS